MPRSRRRPRAESGRGAPRPSHETAWAQRMIPCRPVTNLGGDRVMSPLLVLTSLALFVLAGLCEIGGGYLVWLWLREGRSALLAVLGGTILFVYGVVPTLQPAPFGRVYAAYGAWSAASRRRGGPASSAGPPIGSTRPGA